MIGRRPLESDPSVAQVCAEICDAIVDPILILDERFRIQYANRAFREILVPISAETLGESIFDLEDRRWDIPELRSMLAGVSPFSSSNTQVELDLEVDHLGRRRLLVNARWVSTPRRIVVAVKDVTHRSQVRERSTALELLHRVTRAANEAHGPLAAIEAALEAVCDQTPWQIGHAWQLAEDGGTEFVSTELWYHRPGSDPRRLREATERLRFPIGEGLAGRIAERALPLEIPDLDEFDEWVRGPLSELGVRSATGFPVIVDGGVIAVLEFFSGVRTRLDPLFLDVMIDMGVQLGHVIDRSRLERAATERSDRERSSVARELHDSLGQQIAGVTLLAGSLHRGLVRDGSQRTAASQKLIDALEEAKRQVRAMAKGLLPAEIDSHGLHHALDNLADVTQQGYPDLEIRALLSDTGGLRDGGVATQLYRIAQEAVNNAVTHARPRAVSIRLSNSPSALDLEIRDDGVGLPTSLPPGSGSGIRIMQHRAGLIGGDLTIHSAPGRGTSVRVRVAAHRLTV